MEQQDFNRLCDKYAMQIERMKAMSHALHASVNQTYGGSLPYGVHLDMVVEGVRRFGHEVCVEESDVMPMFFSAYYHDSIEDARVTYHDVMAVAAGLMSGDQALLAAEIVFALTNNKGRTRAERADGRYYEGIRSTPYAPFVKLADRVANTTFSHRNASGDCSMRDIYDRELPHFLASIDAHSDDKRFHLPPRMVACLLEMSER